MRWNENWERTYKITIGTRKYRTLKPEIVQAVLSGVTIDRVPTDSDFTTYPSNARYISNLVSEGFNRRGFTFKFNTSQKATTKGADSEQTILELRNLNEDMVEVINQDRCVIIVEAGYQQELSLVYTGDVVEVSSTRSSSDTIYKIKCSAGGLDLRNMFINASYAETMDDRDIIMDMAGKFPSQALGTCGLDAAKGKYKIGGSCFTGNLTTEFDKKLGQYHLKYTFLNGKIVILPYKFSKEEYELFNRNNFHLDSKSIKNITPITKKQGKSTSDLKASLRNLQISTFFTPAEVGQFITVPESKNANLSDLKKYSGTYVVIGRTVSLDTTSGAWDTVFEVEEV